MPKKKLKLSCHGEKMLCQRIEPKEQEGLILLAGSAIKEKNRAEVLAVGEDVTYYKVGDKIIVGQHQGQQFEFEDEIYITLHQNEPLAEIV